MRNRIIQILSGLSLMATLQTEVRADSIGSVPPKTAGRAASVPVTNIEGSRMKLDAALLMALHDAPALERSRSKGNAVSKTFPVVVESFGEQGAIVPVFVDASDVEGTRREIISKGGEVSSVVGSILLVRIPLSQLESLAGISSVRRIAGSQYRSRKLDLSRNAMKITQVHSGAGLSRGYRGAGVIVGVVDSGIDWSHSDFKDATGKSRILSLWDMSRSGRPPAGFNHGNECSGADIDAGRCSEQDGPLGSGHGTHVAGIAAGNGRGNATLSGVAPEADIVFVKGTRTADSSGGFSDMDVVDAVRYIFGRAAALGKPAVINLSLGGHAGTHDGKSPYEKALTELIGPGRFIVAANGNEGGDRIHVGYTATGTNYVSGISTFWRVPASAADSFAQFFQDSGTLTLGIDGSVVENGRLRKIFRSPAVVVGQEVLRVPVTDGTRAMGFISIETQRDETTGTKGFQVQISDGGNASIDLSKVMWEVYTFGSGRVDGWIIDSTGADFDPFADPGYAGGDTKMTVGVPATAVNMIAVGSYVTKTGWTDATGQSRSYGNTATLGASSGFSSFGPTRDNRPRPLVSAPGQAIAATLSSTVKTANRPSDRDKFLTGNYRILEGTSMAAPHVAGLVALMLQANPNTTVAEMFNALRAGAKLDAQTGSAAGQLFGNGKIEGLDAVRALPPATNTCQPCVANTNTACLLGNRFRVTMSWRNAFDNPATSGNGRVVVYSENRPEVHPTLGPLAETTYFSMFPQAPTRVELAVKMFKGVGINNRYWVYFAGLADNEYTVTVTDTQTCAPFVRTKAHGSFSTIVDQNAFPFP